ncbi:neuroligin-4, X-linked-like [Cimex lectularius]|uniref:Carboxylesterase type B domain-containing protein n=1 Tax=Cimex lectularius TaxID=79782 RepID=A0A8I6SLC2_CIMLE|nr:neuroligin-4, X-linked-like [Cimex lectularius]XP_024084409.1 neuroligin-4, X-linked-like [Cimex lectularius]
MWVCMLLCLVTTQGSDGGGTLTRVISTRFGKVQGFLRPMGAGRHLKPIEVYLGVPYATPPTGSNRFSPTRTAAPWEGVKMTDKFGPVCPQKLPDIRNETAALERMPRGRLEYLKRLLPYLQNQSEDCLYLNIYAPSQGIDRPHKCPVIVYIHGESYEWNSGNPYDGSVLASYADLVVITLNYRLGILGFLNANIAPQLKARVANYGLMDQVAALHWLQQNIALFGGDPSNVTMVGHGTGAACINFLMISPTVMPGLFHRAILLSGSALSSWALVEDPVDFAVRLAKHVNCTVPEDLYREHESIVDCLKDVSLADLMSADITAPAFLSAFGPSVDGVVIKADFHENLWTNFLPEMTGFAPQQSMNVKRSGDSITGSIKYDLLFGVVTSESMWRFSSNDIQAGFEGERRDKILRTYVRNAYTYHLSEIFFTVVNEYTDWERTVLHPINTRDATVAALSDAQFVAPVVATGDLLSKPMHSSSPKTHRSFFYVFDYQTKDGDYPQRMGTVHGEELPYMLGAPLVDGFSHFPKNYTKSEVALSEAVIMYISNFAKTGNPNDFQTKDTILAGSKERNRFRSINWEEYDPVHQKYLEIGMKPKMKNHFRAHQLSVWLRLIPELHRAGMEDVVARHNLFRNHNDDDLYDGIVRADPLSRNGLKAQEMQRRSGMNGTVAEVLLPVTTMETMVTTCVSVQINQGYVNQHVSNTTDTLASLEAAGYAAYSTALSVTIAIGCSLLILNILIFAGVYYQRDKTRMDVKNMQQRVSSFESGKSFPPSASVIVDVDDSVILTGGTLPRSHATVAQHHSLATLPRQVKTAEMPPNGSAGLHLPRPPPPPRNKSPPESQPLLNQDPGKQGKPPLRVPQAAISEMRV